MTLKRIERYRGFNIYTEEIRVGIWGFAVVRIPSSEVADIIRTPYQGRVPGEHKSKESALEAARTHIDRIHQNRKNRTNQETR